MKPVIVGLDIGTTTGIAIYDLDRNLICSGSKRNISIDGVVREISFYGKPLVIATDKKKVPQPIAKIAASFNCVVFSPDHDLLTEEKDNIIRIPIKDVHEKDALSAATFAIKNYSAQFGNIDRNLESVGLSDLRDRVKEMIVSRQAKNISEAIEKLRPKEEKVIERVEKETYLNWRERAKNLESQLKDERRRNEILKCYCDKIEGKKMELERVKQSFIDDEMKKNEDARRKVLREKEIMKREILIRQLQFELSKQRNLKDAYEESVKTQDELESIGDESKVPVIIIPDFSRETISLTNRKFGIANKMVWVENFSPSKPSASFISSLKPKVVIGELDEETKNALSKSGIIVVDTVTPEKKEYLAAISPDKIENEIKKAERKGFLNWLENYRNRI